MRDIYYEKPLLFIIFIILFTPRIFSQTKQVSLQSYNIPNKYIGAETEEAYLFSQDKGEMKEYTTFNIVPGLTDNNYISLQWVVEINYYLRHQNGIIKLNEYSPLGNYQQDATFNKVKGLADSKNPLLVSFESINFPGQYIRHVEDRLFIAENDGSDIFKSDATFKIVPPNWDGKTRLTPLRKKIKPATNADSGPNFAFIIYLILILVALNFVFTRMREGKKEKSSKPDENNSSKIQ